MATRPTPWPFVEPRLSSAGTADYDRLNHRSSTRGSRIKPRVVLAAALAALVISSKATATCFALPDPTVQPLEAMVIRDARKAIASAETLRS